MVYLELRQKDWGFSRVTMGNSGSLLCCLREVQSPFECKGERKIALESRQGNRASICIERGRKLEVLLKLQQENLASLELRW